MLCVRLAGFCYWRRTLIVSIDETVKVPDYQLLLLLVPIHDGWPAGRVVCRTSNNLYDVFCRTKPLIDGALPLLLP